MRRCTNFLPLTPSSLVKLQSADLLDAGASGGGASGVYSLSLLELLEVEEP